MEAAELLGVQCHALRGHRQFPDETPVGIEHHLLESVRELVPLPEPKESKNCLRVCIVNTRRRYD